MACGHVLAGAVVLALKVVLGDLNITQMCCSTFLVLDTVSCYVQCPLQAFDCKGDQSRVLNIIFGPLWGALG